jgi:DNA mismatch repair ATPase MutS
VKDIKDVSEFLYEEVRRYSPIFNFIEKYNYAQNNSIKSLLQPFLNTESSPSKELKKINLTIEILYLEKNPFVWFFLICIVPLDYLLSINVERFKKSIKTDFPIWVNTWHKLEAYSSLAEFAYLNPDYYFPEIIESSDLLNGKNIGHPLIKSDQKITNDFLISESATTNIITGSNMSGKSTFLRTIGINILLAYAGSVVNAQKFVISRINLFTCIKVSDSVVDGISYFYSEVKRLKEIIDNIKTNDGHSLVLIDEVYKGTNNVERLIGSRALVKYFSKQNIYNIVSTHDVELVKIAEQIANVKNFHFKEIIQDSKMSFDYKLMLGPCPTTNALKIMQLEGLPT